MSLTQKKLFGLPLGRYDTEEYFRFVFICCNIRYQLDVLRHIDGDEIATDYCLQVDEELGLIYTPTQTIKIQSQQTWTSSRYPRLYRVSELNSDWFLSVFQASNYNEGMIDWISPPSEHRTRQQKESIESWQEYCESQKPDPSFSTGRFTKPALRTNTV